MEISEHPAVIKYVLKKGTTPNETKTDMDNTLEKLAPLFSMIKVGQLYLNMVKVDLHQSPQWMTANSYN